MSNNPLPQIDEPKRCAIIPGRTRRNEFLNITVSSPDIWRQLHSINLKNGYWLESFIPSDNKDGFTLTLNYNRLACPSCNACKPSRISVHEFNLTQAQRDLIADTPLSIHHAENPNPDEHIKLSYEYNKARHPSPDMTPEFHQMYWPLKKALSQCMEFRDGNGKLVAGILFQHTNTAAVADHYYYDTAALEKYPKLPLYLKLQMIEYLKTQKVTHVYLGAWSNEPSGLSPKARLQGLQILEGDEWRELSRKERGHAMAAYFRSFPPQLSTEP